MLDAGHGNWHEFGGLNDVTYAMPNLRESRTSVGWPLRWVADYRVALLISLPAALGPLAAPT